MFKNITRLLVVFLLACGFSVGIFADEDYVGKTGSISVALNEEVDGVVFELYRVAYLKNEKVEFVLTPDFKECPIDINKPHGTSVSEYADDILTTANYVTNNNIAPMDTKATEKGKVEFNDLKPGLYLLTGPKSIVIDGDKAFEYTLQSAFVSIPVYDENNEFNYNVTVNNKYVREDITDEDYSPLTSLTVVKKFDDAGYENSRPKEIEIDLYKNDELYDTCVLNEENSFTYTWKGLLKSENWSVKERETDKYEVIYSDNVSKVITITNKYIVPPSDKPELPNTGVLWWPVPVMLAGGLVLVLTGIIHDKKHEA